MISRQLESRTNSNQPEDNSDDDDEEESSNDYNDDDESLEDNNYVDEEEEDEELEDDGGLVLEESESDNDGLVLEDLHSDDDGLGFDELEILQNDLNRRLNRIEVFVQRIEVRRLEESRINAWKNYITIIMIIITLIIRFLSWVYGP